MFGPLLLIVSVVCLVGCGGGRFGSGDTILVSTIPSSFFGFEIQNPCSISNTSPAGECANPELHNYPGLPFAWARSIAPGNLKWSDLEQCDPTGEVCPIAGSGCSKDGLGVNGQPCPTADLIPNCHPSSLQPGDPNNCAYNWTNFDFWISIFNAHGTDWMYTAYYTPDYLSVRGSRCTEAGQADFGPDATCLGAADVCQNKTGLMWGCDPPFDVDAIPGSGLADGTDQNYMWFVSAVAQHMENEFETLKYWEVWNQPDVCSEWNHNDQPGTDCTVLNPGGGPSFGTVTQLVRLATDARAIFPLFVSGVKISSPAIADAVADAGYMQQLLSVNTAAFDYIDYDAYFSVGPGCPSQCPVPEMETVQWAAVEVSVNEVGLTTKPILDTEFSWGATTDVTDPDMRAAFAARSHILQESYYPLLVRVSWYGEDFPVDFTPNPNNDNEPNGGTGELWASGLTYLQDNCLQPDGTQGGYDCPAGLAVSRIAKWTVGTSFLAGCTCSASPNGGSCSATPPSGIWQCPIAGSNAYRGLIVWDSTATAFPCLNLPCGNTIFTVPSQYPADWQDLNGDITQLDGAATVLIGAKPILLENE